MTLRLPKSSIGSGSPETSGAFLTPCRLPSAVRPAGAPPSNSMWPTWTKWRPTPPYRQGTQGLLTCDPLPSRDPTRAASRAGGGQRQAWRRGIEGDHILVVAHDGEHTAAWSRQLAAAHAALRKQLHNLQTNLAAAHAGSVLPGHCLAFLLGTRGTPQPARGDADPAAQQDCRHDGDLH